MTGERVVEIRSRSGELVAVDIGERRPGPDGHGGLRPMRKRHPLDVEIADGICAIRLSGEGAAGRTALLDEADLDLIAPYSWHVREGEPRSTNPHGPYAWTSFIADGTVRTRAMHRIMTGWPITDHIDHDGLNNRRSNLRAATRVQNAGNRLPSAGGSSIYKGVYWRKEGSKWSAAIGYTENGRRRTVHLGFFSSETAAAGAYDVAAIAKWGAYALTNFPVSGAA